MCETNGIQIPNNVRIPLLQRLTPILTAAFKLQLLRRNVVVLMVDYHELLVLNFILVLWLSL
jgi:hypothetical protein